MKETQTFALDNYYGFPLSHRHKRRLINELGKLSHALFRTAMNEDVDQLRNWYNRVVLLASPLNKAIYFKFKHIVRFEEHMHDIAFYATTLRPSLNTVETNIRSL